MAKMMPCYFWVIWSFTDFSKECTKWKSASEESLICRYYWDRAIWDDLITSFYLLILWFMVLLLQQIYNHFLLLLGQELLNVATELMLKFWRLWFLHHLIHLLSLYQTLGEEFFESRELIQLLRFNRRLHQRGIHFYHPYNFKSIQRAPATFFWSGIKTERNQLIKIISRSLIKQQEC